MSIKTSAEAVLGEVLFVVTVIVIIVVTVMVPCTVFFGVIDYFIFGARGLLFWATTLGGGTVSVLFILLASVVEDRSN